MADINVDLPSAVTEQIVKEGQPLTDNIKKILLGARNLIGKNVWRTGNSLALLFKGVSNFDAQNPVIGSLLREIDSEKKKITSDLISKAPQINDVILRRMFENLRKTDEPYNANDDDDNSDDNDGFPG